MLGVSTALDTLAAQAHGAGDFQAVRRWSIIASAVLLALCIPAAALLWAAEFVVLHAFGQPPETARMVGMYCIGLIPGLPFMALFTGLQKYQQAQVRMEPSVLVGMATNVFNAAFNYWFIWGLGLGYIGSPLATSCSRVISLLLLAATELRWRSVLRSRDPNAEQPHQLAMESGETNMRLLRRFLDLGLQGGLMMGLEAWSFELQTILAGLLGQTALDAHTIMLTVASFTFVAFPFGISIAASIRIGNLLGAQKPSRACAAMWASILLGVGFMGGSGLLIFLFRDGIGSVFTTDEAVNRLVAIIAPIAALFSLVDGLVGVCGGVFRGLGRQRAVTLINVVAFWLLGVPLGAIFAFPLHMGVTALWWGLCLGLSTSSVGYAVLIYQVDWSREAQLAHVRSTINPTAATGSPGDKAWPLLSSDLH